jgi:hypothetical protein
LSTSWKSQTRSVPVFASPLAPVSAVDGAQAVAVSDARTTDAVAAAMRAGSCLEGPSEAWLQHAQQAFRAEQLPED